MKIEEALEYIINKFNPKEYVIARELHKNGHPHLHVYLRLEGAMRSTDSRFADLPGGYHGNYQGCRSAKNVIRYCTKDEDYLSNIDVSSILQKQSSRREDFSDLLLRKRNLEELLAEKPQYLINYQSLSNSLKAYFEATAPPALNLPSWLPNPWGKVLPVLPEKIKRRHYHIYSSGPNAGKTTWANTLRQYGVTIVANKEPYWEITQHTRIIILDEYNTARLRFDELNAIADGNYSFRRFQRGTYQFQPGRFPIVILMSNVHLYDIYPHMHNLLYARYKEIDISQFKFN